MPTTIISNDIRLHDRPRQDTGGPILRGPVRFIGRERELEQVCHELDTPVPLGGAFLVSIAGVGGVGKSTLVRQLLQVRRGATYVTIDERDRVDSTVGLATLVARRVSDAIGPESHCGLALSGSRAFAEDIVTCLTEALLADVNAADGRQMVLVMDTYEALRDVVGPWLLETLLGRESEPVRGDLRILVSGREPIQRTDRRWICDWEDLIVNVDLEPFSLAETQAFLQSRPGRHPISAEVIRAAHKTTGGLPAWLGLIGRGRKSAMDASGDAHAEDVQYIVDRLLMWWDDPDQRRWVRTAWIPHWFNLEILRVLLGEDAEAAFDWLTHQAALVYGQGGRWIFHDTIRSALRQEAYQRAPSELAEAHERLAEYWSRPGATQTNAFNLVYHRLLGREPVGAIRSVCSLYVQALGHGEQKSSSIIDAALAACDEAPVREGWEPIVAIEAHWHARASENQEVLAEARNRLINLDILDASDRALLLAEAVPEAVRPAPAAEAVKRGQGWLRRGVSTSDAGRARQLLEYGDALRLAGDYEASLPPLSEALQLDPKNAAAWGSRGETYRALNQAEMAVHDLSRAVRLQSDWSWAWAARAAAHLAAGASRKSMTDATRALRLDPQNAWALAVRGLAEYMDFGGPVREAVDDLRQALHMDPGLTWARAALERWEAELAALV